MKGNVSMIIQTGMRTDIPAFYSDWFANRLREGFVLVRNPYNPSSVTRYDLNPDVVDMIGFCSKNPAPMLKYMDLLKPYGQYWFVTITPYGKEIEPNVPDKDAVIAAFCRMSEIVGVNSMGWRYDPILIDQDWTAERHIEEFSHMAQKLAGFTKTCVISFIDLYPKVRQNFPEARKVSKEQRLALGKEIIKIAASHGMTVKPCAEGDELAAFGADCGGCMRISDYEKAIGRHLNAPRKKTARADCACYLSCDIGAYNTCRHFCKYCYANAEPAKVLAHSKLHDPASPFLIGSYMDGDKIHDVLQKSWIDDQIRLEL
jgi:hypothetical protein